MKASFASRALSFIGKVLSLICIFYIASRIFVLWEHLGNLKMSFFDVFLLGIIVITMAAVSYFYCYMWGTLVEVLSGKKLDFIHLAHLFAKSNLAKYLPGNVMQYVARSVLAQKYDIPLSTTGTASFIDILVIVVSAFLFITLALPFEAIRLPFTFPNGVLPVGGLGVVGIIIFFIWKGTSLKKKFFHLDISRKFFFVILCNIVLYLIYYAILSCVFFVLLNISGIDLHKFVLTSWPVLRDAAGLFALSWLAGYLTLGAPAGIGVREVMLITLFQNLYPQENILLAAFLLRIVTIVSEVFAWLFSAEMLRRRLF